MSWVLRTMTGAIAALTLVACSPNDARSSTSGSVPWKDYAPALQAKIDAMATANDCAGLQLEFNEIGATNLAVSNQFGHGNVEILNYIDNKERAASCFNAVTTSP